MDSHRVTAPDGTRLQIDEAGPSDAPSVLSVHDLSFNRLVWRHQFESPLADEFRLLALDLRGHGDSDVPGDDDGRTGDTARRTAGASVDDAAGGADGSAPADFDSRAFAADLHAVIEELDLADVCMVAWGHGGVCVADYLDTYGTDAVAGVDLVGALTEVGTQAYADATSTSVADCMPELTSTDVEESIEGLRRLLEISTAESLSLADHHFLLGCVAVTSPSVRETMLSRMVARENFWEHVEVPVLVTHGTSDEVVLTNAARKHVARLPAASPSFYTDVGHMPFWEVPERFNEELRKFVAAL